MVYDIFWYDDEKTILCQRFQQSLTTTDIKEAANMSAAMLATVPHAVDIIIEVDDPPLLLKDLLETTQHLNRIVPPNQRLVIVIGAGHLLRSMIAIWGKIAPKATEKIHFMDTLDDALAYIEAYRSSRP